MNRSRSAPRPSQQAVSARPWAGWTAVAASALVSAVLMLGACSTSTTTSGSSPDGAGTGAAASSKKLNIAYFVFSTQNSYEAPMIAAVEKEAGAENAGVTTFDATSNAQKQYGQIQDAIATGKYDGFLIDAVDGAGLVPLVTQAVSQNIKVVALNTVLGPDLAKGEPQVGGMSASVVYVGYSRGQHEAKLVQQACATVQSGDCHVGYMFDVKASGFDQGVRAGFDSVISSDPKIQVVAEGEGKFSAPGGLAAAQTMLQAHPEIDVFVGSDQGMQGATQAVASASKSDQVKIIGLGGSVAGLARVKAGTWFGTVMTMPATQGRLAAQAIVKAVRGSADGADGADSGWVNPVADLPDDGLVTQANVGRFTGEWSG